MSEKEQVNRRNSRLWVKMNEDAKSHHFRNRFIENHGGKFVKEGKYWKWIAIDFEKLIIEKTKTNQQIKIKEKKIKRGNLFLLYFAQN